MPIRTFAVLLLLCLLVPQPARAALLPAPALLADDGYTESYTLTLALERGGYAHVQIAITNTGPGEGRAVCRGLVVAGNVNRRAQEVVSPGEWTYRAAARRLEVGSCVVAEADGGLFARWKHDGGELRVTVPGPLRPAALPRIALAGGLAFDATLVADAAPAKLTWTPGVTAPVAARAYVEHTRATVPPSDMGRRWYRLRSTDTSEPVTALIYLAGEGDAGAGWVLTGGAARPYPRLRARAPWIPDGTPHAFNLGDGTLELRTAAPVATYAPLRELGLIGRVLGAIVGDPLISIERVEWRAGGAVRQGVLETTTFR